MRAVTDWVPDAFDDVENRLKISMIECEGEVPDSAHFIKGMCSYAYPNHHALRDRYLELAVMSDEEVKAKSKKVTACEDKHMGKPTPVEVLSMSADQSEMIELETTSIEAGIPHQSELLQLRKERDELKLTNQGLHSAYESNQFKGEKLLEVLTKYTEKFSDKYGPIEQFDEAVEFLVEIDGQEEKRKIKDIYFTELPSDPTLIAEMHQDNWAERRQRALQDE